MEQNKFIPYEKLSKKKKRECDNKKRKSWGSLNPVTRKSKNPQAYNRAETNDMTREMMRNGIY